MADRTSALPSGLNLSQYAFCLHWQVNGFNASAAYRSAHPTASKHTARVEGNRTLTKPAVQAFLAQQLGSRWKALHMDGDEVLARVAMDARADPRLLFDEHGKPLRPDQWPNEIANSIESVKLKDDGSLEVRLASKSASRRTILEVTGKVKGADGGIDELAEALRATLKQHNAKA